MSMLQVFMAPPTRRVGTHVCLWMGEAFIVLSTRRKGDARVDVDLEGVRRSSDGGWRGRMLFWSSSVS